MELKIIVPSAEKIQLFFIGSTILSLLECNISEAETSHHQTVSI